MDDFKIKLIDGIAIIKVEILAATHRDAKPLWDELESKLIFSRKKIIIDLSFCTYVESTFIGMIIKILRRVNEKNGQLVLVFPKKNSTNIFSLVRIDTLLPCYDTLEEAMANYGSKRAIQTLEFAKIFSAN